MKVSVVILNWNAEHLLRQFLPSVTQHSRLARVADDEVEVVVADNGSTDDSLDMLRREYPTVRIIALDRNYGFAEGYDRALAQIDATYAVLLNDDVEVTDGWLDPLVQFMDAHDDYAACQPKLMSWRERDRFEYAGACGGYLDRYGYPFCRGRVFNTVETDVHQYDEPADVLWATGACLFIRMNDYRQAGGLDGRFFAHMEEIDLCWRLRCRGRRIACVPTSTVYHVGGASLAAGSPRKTFLNFRNNLLMLYKNLPDDELRPVLRVRALLDIVAAFSFLAKGEGGNFRAVFRARREFRHLRGEYADVRADNLAAAAAAGNPTLRVPERCHLFLLVRYHLRHQRTYSQLTSQDK